MSDQYSGPCLSGVSDVKKARAGETVSWQFSLSGDAAEAKLTFSEVAGPDAETAPDWILTVTDATGAELWSSYRSRNDIAVEVPGKRDKELVLHAECPKGARYGDEVAITVKAECGGARDSMEFNASAIQSVMILKTQMDQERSAADSLAAKANLGEKDIYAILSPAGLRGYVFVEGMNTDRLREKIRDIRKAYSFIPGETSLDEINHYLTPVSAVVGITEGDIVELVNGPFKGEKARVQHIDEGKEEITVELIEAMVPIPVTVKGDSVRVIDKER
ncbi:MAG: transcription elongation factor Spt5 [Gammaproteobacteria bacterium]|jgi:transcriptional antiterminator NusG|nr:transcription elongation factor Spt5 [Candidatus Methanomethylophilaceae archaeon]NCA74328.1 transcription elongation factor Spt5 [Gammaproteobacteria bacterium]